MKIKCLGCGRRIKAKPPNRKRCPECQHERRLQQHREHNERRKEQLKQYRRKNKEKINAYCRAWYQRNKEKLKKYGREYRERNREKIRGYRERNRRYQRLYNVYYALRHPFRHTHDRTTDLRIENGRVKGAVWLESQLERRKTDAYTWERRYARKIENLGLSYGKGLCDCGSLQTPFFVAVENHRTYCAECGGKFVIAFENDYYTITEVCCCLCGLVLQQTTP